VVSVYGKRRRVRVDRLDLEIGIGDDGGYSGGNVERKDVVGRCFEHLLMRVIVRTFGRAGSVETVAGG